jgi:hypothetical protein
MTWVGERGFSRRPIVVVEDHLYHIAELLEALSAGTSGGAAGACESGSGAAAGASGSAAGGVGADATGAGLAGDLTVVCLDRQGPDTARAVAGWLAAHPALQVAAAVAPSDLGELGGISGIGGIDGMGGIGGIDGVGGLVAPASRRLLPLAPEVFTGSNRFCQLVAGALRPGGLLLQDIQLSTLAFIHPDRWWESIYLANTVRGMFARRPPSCRFISNKRGYQATFGKELLEAGFDPRDVADKRELASVVVPMLRAFRDRELPFALRVVRGADRLAAVAVSREGDGEEVESELDLVVWHDAGGASGWPRASAAGAIAVGVVGAVELAGRAVAPGDGTRPAGEGSAGSAPRRLLLRAGSHEAQTWLQLVEDRFAGGSGVPVLTVGERLAPPGAGRAEITNLAARHIHTLRRRLRDAAAIVTDRHAYRLAGGLQVGLATQRCSGDLME